MANGGQTALAAVLHFKLDPHSDHLSPIEFQFASPTYANKKPGKAINIYAGGEYVTP